MTRQNRIGTVDWDEFVEPVLRGFVDLDEVVAAIRRYTPDVPHTHSLRNIFRAALSNLTPDSVAGIAAESRK